MSIILQKRGEENLITSPVLYFSTKMNKHSESNAQMENKAIPMTTKVWGNSYSEAFSSQNSPPQFREEELTTSAHLHPQVWVLSLVTIGVCPLHISGLQWQKDPTEGTEPVFDIHLHDPLKSPLGIITFAFFVSLKQHPDFFWSSQRGKSFISGHVELENSQSGPPYPNAHWHLPSTGFTEPRFSLFPHLYVTLSA